MHTDQLGQPATENSSAARLFNKSDLTRVLLVSVLLSLPFLNKAFHIDDPVVLQCAKRILLNPLDPLGGEFDWFGVVMPFWQVTTNPPLLSYYLAPLVWIFGYSEIILHLSMMPFLAGILAGCLALSRRFCEPLQWLPALMIATSSAVLVSSNVMRDIPALALICVGLAVGIQGLDTGRSLLLSVGSLLLGLAAVTKYSAGVAVVILVLYALMSTRKIAVLPLLPSILPLGIWCGWTWLVYGEAHPWFLLLGKHSSGSFSTADKFFSLLVTLGSVCLLAPLIAWRIQEVTRRAKLLVLGGTFVLALAAWWYHAGEASSQNVAWTVVGSFSLLGVLVVGLVSPGQADGYRIEIPCFSFSGHWSSSLSVFPWFPSRPSGTCWGGSSRRSCSVFGLDVRSQPPPERACCSWWASNCCWLSRLPGLTWSTRMFIAILPGTSASGTRRKKSGSWASGDGTSTPSRRVSGKCTDMGPLRVPGVWWYGLSGCSWAVSLSRKGNFSKGSD